MRATHTDVGFKKIIVCIALGSVSSLAFLQTYASLERAFKMSARKPNILVISLCSLRMNDAEAAPNIGRFFKNSTFLFTNAFNGMGWTYLYSYIYPLLQPRDFGAAGYYESRSYPDMFGGRIPRRRSWRQDMANKFVNDNDFEKDLKEDLGSFEKSLKVKNRQPFFVFVHFKYLHFPMIDRFNSEAKWDRYLSAEEREIVLGYLLAPEKYSAKLPLLLLLANNPHHVLAHPRFKKEKLRTDPASLRRLSGMLTDPALLNEWKSSAGYDGDLQILAKIYRANLHYLDQLLAPVLNLYGDKDLQKNTIIVLSGDHGESHMEHGDLTHGLSLWDTALRVPLAVHFPGESRRHVIDSQIDYLAFTALLKKILEGDQSAARTQRNIAALSPGVMVARDCKNSLRGLRYKNKYKYFVRIADGERYLFDLETDPQESQNLAALNPALAGNLESLYWRNLEPLRQIDTAVCAPW